MLTGKQKHYLRGLAHKRKPAVAIGQNGVTDSVIAELEQALAHHELVKIKLPPLAKKERKQLITQLSSNTQATEIQSIGRIGVLYRAAKKPKIELPIG